MYSRKRDMKATCKFLILTFLLSFSAYARDHLIYSIDEEVPMGYENEKTKKNYYVNIGANQGVKSGTVLDVFRVISKSNPYNNLKRVNYKVKIGELEVLHSDDEAAIGSLKLIKLGVKDPLFEIRGFMIGDSVSVSIND
jgi:hypothetical protein